MKKSLIAFFVAFALSIGFTFLPLVTRALLSGVLQSNFDEAVYINLLISIIFMLVGLSVFFVVFYFLANNNNILAVKSTVAALLLGVTLGTAISILPNIFFYSSYYSLYLNWAAGSAVLSIFQFFFPALTALLYVELKDRKLNSSLV